jgi:hypothetical protein
VIYVTTWALRLAGTPRPALESCGNHALIYFIDLYPRFFIYRTVRFATPRESVAPQIAESTDVVHWLAFALSVS